MYQAPKNIPERQKNDGNTSETVVSSISISMITTQGQMVRAEINDDHVIELSNSIARHGLLEPIVVTPVSNGFQLVAGLHRLLACQRLGWKEIPAVIREMKPDDSIKSLAMIENIIRKDMSLEEECTAVMSLYTEEKLSISQICDLLGRSRAWVETRLSALSLPENIRKALFSGMIPLKSAMKIAEVENEGYRNSILNQVITQKLPYYTVEQLVSLAISCPSMDEAIEQGLTAIQDVSYEEATQKTCCICGRRQHLAKMTNTWMCRAREECIQHLQETAENAN